MMENELNMPEHSGKTPNDKQEYEISAKDLPLHCPLPGTSLWNSHPKVYLPIEDNGNAQCPYCGTKFVLR